MVKGQLSVIIIIGLVVAIMIGLVYYIVNSSSETKSVAGVRNMQSSRELVTPVKEFVDGCLRAAATEALDEIGKQGGVLYPNQGGLSQGSIQYVTTAPYDGHDVWYGLDAPVGDIHDRHGTLLYSSDTPEYPWHFFPCDTEQCGTEYYKGYFGIEHVPLLNGTPSLTIEKQLMAAVASKVDACFDWSKFKALPITITTKPSNVKVFLDDQDTTFELNASVKVAMQDGSGESVLPFSTLQLPVRLKKIQTAAKNVLAMDATDITFDPSTYTQDGILVSVLHDVPGANPGDDLITFTDTRGKLEGIPYEFRVMRHDRPPALIYIPDPTKDQVDLCPGSSIARAGNHTTFLGPDNPNPPCGNGAVTANPWPPQSFHDGEITALDPDEDNIDINITVAMQNLDDATPSVTIPTPTGSPKHVDVVVTATERDDPTKQDTQIVSIPADVSVQQT